MSQYNNVNKNNQCKTDAYQAHSDIEDDDFITLSDIMPPPPENTSLLSPMNDLPSEGDYLQAISYDDIIPSNSNKAPVIVEHIAENDSLFSPDVTDVPMNKIKKKRRKKGKKVFTIRKKKSLAAMTPENASPLNDNADSKLRTSNDTVSSICKEEVEKNLLNTPQPAGKRRGRKKKVDLVNESESLPVLETPLLDSPEPKSNGKRSYKKLRKSLDDDTMCANKITETKIPKKKRKAKLQNNIPKENELTEDSLNLPKETPKCYEEDDADDVCLSQLKKSLKEDDDIKEPVLDTSNDFIADLDIEEQLPKALITENQLNVSTKRNPKKHIMMDFEYNIDKVIPPEHNTDLDSPLDDSKRPRRRKANKMLHYDESSDEDPYANVELSDDEPKRRRKGTKYFSDDEYRPGGQNNAFSEAESSEADNNELESQSKKKMTIGRSPSKRGRKKKSLESVSNEINNTPTVSKLVPQNSITDDIEECLESSIIKADTPNKTNTWGTTNEFENFLALKTQLTSLKIKKVCHDTPEKNITPLEIPVINPNEVKKCIDDGTQTDNIKNTSQYTQTSSPFESKMIENITLTYEQSTNACNFLRSIVKTTAELGHLMTEKSEDFIKKKINATNVVDTFKIDYCVKKSFLLFKLAKHNLIQMEDDLEKAYEEFLTSNNLSKYREEVKKVTAAVSNDSDSDCEIVEETNTNKSNVQPKFNPKTVFLNKELSIKITKKNEEKLSTKIDAGGRHTVWINDSIMVKKVGTGPSTSVLKKPVTTQVKPQVPKKYINKKPTQSFLAQDSRNKKPPDYKNVITEEMVSSFFENYFRAKALSICAPFIRKDLLPPNNQFLCYYFIKTDNFAICNINTEETETHPNTETNISSDAEEHKQMINNTSIQVQTLFLLCTKVLQIYFSTRDHTSSKNNVVKHKRENNLSLSQKCFEVNSLQSLSYRNVVELLRYYECRSNDILIQNPLKKYINNKIQNFETKNLKQTLKYNVSSLFSICIKNILLFMENQNIQNLRNKNENVITLNEICTRETLQCNALSLFSICVNKINLGLYQENHNITEYDEGTIAEYDVGNTIQNNITMIGMSPKQRIKYNTPTLLSICLKKVQLLLSMKNINIKNMQVYYEPLFLNRMCIDKVNHYIFSCQNKHTQDQHKEKHVQQVNTLANISFKYVTSYFQHTSINNIHTTDPMLSLTIDEVNTLSEEAFHNIDTNDEAGQYFEDDYIDDDDDDNCLGDTETSPIIQNEEEHSWVAQLQLKELKSYCNKTDNNIISKKTHKAVNDLEILQIKQEPVTEVDYEPSPIMLNIKAEPLNGDEMTLIPENVVTKLENPGNMCRNSVDINSDEQFFESYVNSNSMMYSLMDNADNIFSQSGDRIRRQYDPDSDNENEYITENMNLLIPQLNVEKAKGNLMESSEEENGGTKIIANKKKNYKKSLKGKAKKGDKTPSKIDTDKVSHKEILMSTNDKPNEVAMLTRKMKEKNRQGKRKIYSSDSDIENIINNKIEKKIKKDKKSTNEKDLQCEIQCNNVDSTDQILDGDKMFTGFSAIDQNEISAYQKYMKYVYEKIIPNSTDIEDENIEKLKISNELVELLECEPTMPMLLGEPTESLLPSKIKNQEKSKAVKQSSIKNTSVDKDGWKCYPLNSNDPKLLCITNVLLEKLPEDFDHPYIISDPQDVDINRLINLQTLNKTRNKKSMNKSHVKIKDFTTNKNDKKENLPIDEGLQNCMDNDDHLAELTPSEDEEVKEENLISQPTPIQAIENYIAKNSLMNDNNDSDSDTPLSIRILQNIKVEPDDDTSDRDNKKVEIKYKPGPKCSKRTQIKTETTENFMLTADKMMNKELNLLNGPVIMKEDDHYVTPVKLPLTKIKKKSPSNLCNKSREKNKNADDSSSEEEKQWVNTKEKLLKRLNKKEIDTSVDDAKRAKIVMEFLEKRSDRSLRKRPQFRSKRSRKKLLEQQKQLRVLTKELFGESSIPGKKSTTFAKGRRNIRKVIDKKSLTRSTVVANMEEFERKRRLGMRDHKLREILGYEEGVNVVVINDEVCLEYDFDQLQPVVTVHPFFTKVMKAHQYEGVKFMWDSCFESLELIESGHSGSGCILAHCMGLGKTLQVLALLHTVLTHPRVSMQRILVVCPLSTVLNWVDEIHKWIGPVTDKIKVFELSKFKKIYQRAFQLEDWYNGGGIFIIGYELFRSLSTLDPEYDDVRPTVLQKIRSALLDPGPDLIVCDEGHLLKNDSSVLAVSMSRVATKRRIVLTGTPMQNNLREYYCMVNFVKPNLLGTYSEYSNRFENPIMNGQHRDSQVEDIKLMKARTHILHKVLEGCLQRQEVSVLYPYLPKKHEYTVFISLTKCQSEMYKHYLSKYTTKNKQTILKDFHVLQKIWSHPQVLHNFLMRTRDEKQIVKDEKLEDDLAREDLTASVDIKPQETEVWWLQYLYGGTMLECLESSNKFVAVFKILEECVSLGDKLLIFSTSLFTMDSLEYFLKKINNWSLGQEYYRLDGSVPAEVRQKWCREFNAVNNTKTKVFLISTRAGCLGLNMTAANRVIILDTSWNPAHDIQSIFRVYRFGQKKDCYIYRLVAMGTMEQKMYERSVTKQAIACRVVDEQQIDRHYNMDELTELYSFDESGANVQGGVAAGVQDVVLLRVARHAALHAVHEHDSLLRSSESALPEDERKEAWKQFKQEQHTKHMQTEVPLKSKMILPKRTYSLIKSETVTDSILPDIDNTEIPDAVAVSNDKKQKKSESEKSSGQLTVISGPNSSSKPKSAHKDVVEHITKVLKQFNFHHESQNIGNLLQNIYLIICSPANKVQDRLSIVIAKILKKKNLTQLSVFSNLVCESINNSIKIPEVQPEEVVEEITPDTQSIPMNSQTDFQSDSNSVKSLRTPRNISRKEYNCARKYQKRLSDDSKTKSRNSDDSKTKSQNSNSSNTKSQKQPSPSPNESEPNEYSGRKKRKSAIAAEKYIDLASKGLVNTSFIEDDDSQDEEWVADGNLDTLHKNTPKKAEPTDTVTQNQNIEAPPVESIEQTVEAKTVKEKKPGPKRKTLPVVKIQKNVAGAGKKVLSESILLSDDEDNNIPTVPKKTITLKPFSKISPAPISKLPAESSKTVKKVVPLHKSLLSNENFIKIVAHTYLSGNPMLDEDAALLAAQYSTQKALNEIEIMGNAITGGPIYDIAITVLGETVLEKLHQSNIKTSFSKQAQNPPKQIMQPLAKPIQNSNSKLYYELKIENLKKNSLLELEKCNTDKFKQLSKTGEPKVMSIQLVQPPPPPPPEESECILPDEFFAEPPVQLAPSLPPPVMQPQAIKIAPKKVPHQTKISTTLNKNNTTPKTLPKTDINKPELLTICIDSDEEDTLGPTGTHPSDEAVPVSLTAIGIDDVTKQWRLTTVPAPKMKEMCRVQVLNSVKKTQTGSPTKASTSVNSSEIKPVSIHYKASKPGSSNQTLLKNQLEKPFKLTSINKTPVSLPATKTAEKLDPYPITSVNRATAGDAKIPPQTVINSNPTTSKAVPQISKTKTEETRNTDTKSKRKSKYICRPGDVIRLKENGEVVVLGEGKSPELTKSNKTSEPITNKQPQNKVLVKKTGLSINKSGNNPITEDILIQDVSEYISPDFNKTNKAGENITKKRPQTITTEENTNLGTSKSDMHQFTLKSVIDNAVERKKVDLAKPVKANETTTKKRPLICQTGSKDKDQETSKDPLSILQHVVQIPASRYDKPKAPLSDSQEIKTQKTAQSSRTPTPKQSAQASNAAMPNVKSKSLISIDLTDTSATIATVSGVSKDILLVGGKATTIQTQATTNRDVTKKNIKITEIQTIAPKLPWKDLKRHAAPSSAPAVKKSKQLKTLKDFDIDELDDIIELE